MNDSIHAWLLTKIFSDEISILNNSIEALKLPLCDRKAVCDFTMIVRFYELRYLILYLSYQLRARLFLTFIYESEQCSTNPVATAYWTLFSTTAYDLRLWGLSISPSVSLFLYFVNAAAPLTFSYWSGDTVVSCRLRAIFYFFDVSKRLNNFMLSIK